MRAAPSAVGSATVTAMARRTSVQRSSTSAPPSTPSLAHPWDPDATLLLWWAELNLTACDNVWLSFYLAFFFFWSRAKDCNQGLYLLEAFSIPRSLCDLLCFVLNASPLFWQGHRKEPQTSSLSLTWREMQICHSAVTLSPRFVLFTKLHVNFRMLYWALKTLFTQICALLIVASLGSVWPAVCRISYFQVHLELESFFLLTLNFKIWISRVYSDFFNKQEGVNFKIFVCIFLIIFLLFCKNIRLTTFTIPNPPPHLTLPCVTIHCNITVENNI